MTFGAPHWWILLPILMVVGYFIPRFSLGHPLRAVAAWLAVLFLTDPRLESTSPGLDLWVLVDRSASAEEDAAEQLPEWEALLERSRGSDDRIRYVDYAAEVIPRGTGDGGFSGGRHRTRTRLAIESTLAAMPSDRAARILVISDGYGTEPLTAATSQLKAQDVPLDMRLFVREAARDFSVAKVLAPTRVRLSEPVLIEAIVRGSEDGVLPVSVTRGGALIFQGSVELVRGVGRVRVADRPRRPGAHRYSVRVEPKDDAYSGNDQRQTWVEVDGGRRVVVATGHSNTPVTEALRSGGFRVETIEDLGSLDAGRLSGAELLIFDDVPAYKLKNDVLEAVDFYVREEGGGFVMLGGRHSFGGGGYFESKIDPLLPVSMELRQEHKKLAVAMAIVLDRSCSMGASVGSATKMQLANDGSARAVELLGDRDQVTVLAVDSEPHLVVPLTGVSSARADVERAVRTIESRGGGIFVYEALRAAYEELSKSAVGKRHVVLFSDAADSEQPGLYKSLIKVMVAQDMTISVIGLGTDKDPDAEFLIDIAKRGQGRMFFTKDAAELPTLFAQETVAIARSAFIEEAVGVASTGRWSQVSSKPIRWPPVVDAYNLSYLRKGATTAAMSQDEYEAPLVAFWQRGLGRVAAISFPLSGPGSNSVRAWAGYGDFVQTLARWTIADDVPSGVGLRTEVEGTELIVDLLYDDTWMKRLASDSPRLVLGADGETAREISWSRLGPGHFRATATLHADRWIRGAVQIGPHALPFGPVAASDAVEWTFDERRVEDLRALAVASGGAERLRLEDVWDAPRPARYERVRSWVLVLLLFVFLLEVFVTRVGWRLPELSLPVRSAPDLPPVVRTVESVVEEKAAPTPVEDPDAEARRRRLARAKKRR